MCIVGEAKVVAGAVTARRKVEKVEFDPTNYEHRKAYLMLSKDGRIHPTLRFKVSPSADVLAYMERKICIWACEKGMLN